jgi:glycosyltransferase involved in cell wall biosynthesis
MVVHADYPADARVRREAEALIEAGWGVDVVCLRRPGERQRERCAGVEVHRLPLWRRREGGVATYLVEYMTFFTLASVWVARLHAARPFDVVQAHNMPDFLAFTGLWPKLSGARVVLDVHDPVPELYAARFGAGASHPAVRVTSWVEQRSAAFADHVITVGEPSRRALLGRGLDPEKLTVVINSADPGLFRPVAPSRPKSDPAEFRLGYHGGLFERYGLDLAIRAVHRLRDEIPGLRLEIFGFGELEGELHRLVDELALRDRVLLGGFVPIDEVPGLMAGVDLGLAPYRRSSFTELLYPSKAFEYLAVGVPVIMSRLSAMRELFGEVPDLFVEPGDVEALADRIRVLHADRARLRRLLEAGQRAYEPYGWERQRRRYVELMERLAGGDCRSDRSEESRPAVPPPVAQLQRGSRAGGDSSVAGAPSE